MQNNSQSVEKYVATKTSGAYLDVHSVFYTIQGEGPYSGHPAVFIRLAGCNLQCPGCDTDYTSTREETNVYHIAERVQTFGNADKQPIVVITGGEPFRQNITPLVNCLIDLGYTVQIETNGTLPPPKGLHLAARIVVSPKTGKINSATELRAMAFKYVARGGNLLSDGLPDNALFNAAVPFLARPSVGSKKPIYLQPMDEQDPAANEYNTKKVVDSCMKHGYRLCIQTHKIVGVE